MYWSDFLRVLLRRWYVLVPSLLVTIILASAATMVVPATYRTGTTIVLLPAAGGGSPQQPSASRFSDLPVSSLATLLAEALDGYDVGEQMRQRGVAGKFSALAPQNGAPVVVLSVDDHNAELAARRLTALVELANAQLQIWQYPSRPPNAVTAQRVVAPGPPHPQAGSKIRALVAVLALGAIMSTAFAFLAENEARRRRLQLPAAVREDVVPTHGPAGQGAPAERVARQRAP